MRSLYSAVKVRRLATATTSGSGRDGAGGSGATVLPAAALRSASLRSASLRPAAGKTVGEAEEIPLFFTLIPVLALLSNYDQENCLINVGTEGRTAIIYGVRELSVVVAVNEHGPCGGAKFLLLNESALRLGLALQLGNHVEQKCRLQIQIVRIRDRDQRRRNLVGDGGIREIVRGVDVAV